MAKKPAKKTTKKTTKKSLNHHLGIPEGHVLQLTGEVRLGTLGCVGRCTKNVIYVFPPATPAEMIEDFISTVEGSKRRQETVHVRYVDFGPPPPMAATTADQAANFGG